MKVPVIQNVGLQMNRKNNAAPNSSAKFFVRYYCISFGAVHYASDALVTVRARSRTMEALGSWMSSNRLRLNPHKTQFIWLGTRQQLAKLDMVALTSAFPHFTFFSRVRDLGVTLDQELTLAPHIHSLCRACYYQLHQLRTVSRSLTSTAEATLVHSFVTSRLDHCSSLYFGVPATRLNCLDRVLRSAARLIGRVSKFDHISDHISAYMRDVLHWLPLRQRIEFCRVAVLVWCSLRSAEQSLLHVPFARTSTMQSRAFSVVGPLAWNGLPLALRSLPRVFSQKFLQQLKTTLFGRAGVGSASE